MTENDTDPDQTEPNSDPETLHDDAVQFEAETGGTLPDGTVIGDPGLFEDDAEAATLDPHGITIDLPTDLENTTPAEWDPERLGRLREMLTAGALPRGYHIRAYANTVTGDIHELVAAPSEGVVMGTPNVVSKRPEAGKYAAPVLSPRERLAIYEVRFDPDEFLTDGDVKAYENAVRERHAERMAEMANVADPMDLPPGPHEVYWAEAVAEERDSEE